MLANQDQDEEKLKKLAEALKVYRESMKELEELEYDLLVETMKLSNTQSLKEARKKIESLIP